MIWAEQFRNIETADTLVLPTTKAGRKLIKLALRWERQYAKAKAEGISLGILHPAEMGWGAKEPKPIVCTRSGHPAVTGFLALRGYSTWGNPVSYVEVRISPARPVGRPLEWIVFYNWDDPRFLRWEYRYFCNMCFSRVDVTLRPRSDSCTLGVAISQQERYLQAYHEKKKKAEEAERRRNIEADERRFLPMTMDHKRMVADLIRKKWEDRRAELRDLYDKEILDLVKIESKRRVWHLESVLRTKSKALDSRAEKQRQLRALGVIS